MSVKNLGPLDWRTPIVGSNGAPTPEFQRRWALQIANNGEIPGLIFGSGAPTGTPTATFYFDTSTTPYTFYVAGTDEAWHKGGVTRFTELSDVPSSYLTKANFLVRVNAGATALEFVTQSQELDTISSTRGAMLTRGASAWTALGPATAGYVVHTGGAGADAYLGPVVESDIALANNTTNNVSTTKHGFAPILPNDATKYLDGTGAYSVPAGGGGGGGSVVLLEQHTASSSAALNFVSWYSALYDDYMIEFIDIVPATTATGPLMVLSTNGGSTYDTGANYQWTQNYGIASGAGAGTGQTLNGFAVGVIQTDISSAGWATGNSSSGSMKFYNPAGSRYKKATGHYVGKDSRDTAAVGVAWTGTWLNTAAVNAFQIKMSSGNIASGTVRIYGIAK